MSTLALRLPFLFQRRYSHPSFKLKHPSRPLRRRWQTLILLALAWLLWSLGSRSYNYTHPSVAGDIKRLHSNAKSLHASTLYWQSTSLSAARKEYVRRYNIQPPPGYDDWYAYAVERASPIIDDYDQIMNDLRPFRSFILGGCDMKMNSIKSDDIVRVCAGNGLVGVDGTDREAVQHLVDLMESVVVHLPNLCVVMNTLGQPRTVIPHAVLSSLYGPVKPTTCELQHFQKMDRINIWDDATKSCAQDSSARTGLTNLKSQMGPQVVSNWTEATALCQMASQPSSGLVRSPKYARLSNVVRPLLSVGTLSTFHDIRVPGPHHIAAAEAELPEATPWESKKPFLAWRGDSSGGWASSSNWRDFQRQRMVAVASGKDRDPSLAPAKPKGTPRNDFEAAPTVQRFLDIDFTQITSCDTADCEAQEKELGTKDVAETDTVFQNKLVLSMDGSGADQNLYRLLRSDSAVVKQGIIREWHDSRVVPWLHFIPLSMEMEELSDMVEFLTGEGEDIAEAIAEAGREWAEKALRKEDMDVYLFRLLIEMGRRDMGDV